jgi:hypothetical protein
MLNVQAPKTALSLGEHAMMVHSRTADPAVRDIQRTIAEESGFPLYSLATFETRNIPLNSRFIGDDARKQLLAAGMTVKVDAFFEYTVADSPPVRHRVVAPAVSEIEGANVLLAWVRLNTQPGSTVYDKARDDGRGFRDSE